MSIVNSLILKISEYMISTYQKKILKINSCHDLQPSSYQKLMRMEETQSEN